MKKALVAIDAARSGSSIINNLNQSLARFQKLNLLQNLNVASVIHPDSFIVPFAYYRDQKYRLADDSIRSRASFAFDLLLDSGHFEEAALFTFDQRPSDTGYGAPRSDDEGRHC